MVVSDAKVKLLDVYPSLNRARLDKNLTKLLASPSIEPPVSGDVAGSSELNSQG